MNNQDKKRGRPQGSKTEPAPVLNVELVKCPRCGSTKRSPYADTTTYQISGIKDGVSYTSVTWRHCWCQGVLDDGTVCNRHRIERTYNE